MDKINQGEKITVEHLDGYTWKSIFFGWSFVIFYTILFIETSPDIGFDKTGNILGFLVFIFLYIIMIIFLIIMLIISIYPGKFFHKQYSIYFFKEYLLLENFDKGDTNHQLDYLDIERIYSPKKGFIKIEIDESYQGEWGFSKKGILNLKLVDKYLSNSDELIDYLNNHIENTKIKMGIK